MSLEKIDTAPKLEAYRRKRRRHSNQTRIWRDAIKLRAGEKIVAERVENGFQITVDDEYRLIITKKYEVQVPLARGFFNLIGRLRPMLFQTFG